MSEMDQNLSNSKHQNFTLEVIKMGIPNPKSPLLENEQQITSKKISTEKKRFSFNRKPKWKFFRQASLTGCR